MALSCVFIRKHHFLPYKKIPSIAKKKYCDSSGDVNDHMRNLLCSFVLAFTDSGKITFMENTDQFLVVPPVSKIYRDQALKRDVNLYFQDELLSHTDSVFDLVDQKDHPSLWNLLNGTDSER
jgi:hypothetical protein